MATLTVEVHGDAGIRLTTPDGRSGVATLAATLDWVAESNRAGEPVLLTGVLTAPVAERIRCAAEHVDELSSAPKPWPHGRSSLQTAAADGHVAALVDLLERGADPNEGRGGATPYRLAMQHGQIDALRVLRDAGTRVPRGLDPPAILPNAVVLRAMPPAALAWVSAGTAAVSVVALLAHLWIVAALCPVLAAATWLSVDLPLANTRVAFDGDLVARRRGNSWQGPVDLRDLVGLGYAPAANVRTPALWVLAHRGDGDRPDVFTKRAFSDEQLAALEADDTVRFVPLYAQRGFSSPGIERYLAKRIEGSDMIIGPDAARRLR